KTVLVTVGATVPFPALTDSALTPEFLEALVNLGFGKLQLQHGVYTPRIPDLMEGEQQANGRINIETFAFDKDLALNYIAKADLVVTHAGAGSVLECLRWDKRTIVVENSSLMGGHQRELIEELEGQGYVVEGKLGELEKAVQK
ncbi:glycosyl transferase, partial [Pyronema omphalodes]